jgi:hypothetical protein
VSFVEYFVSFQASAGEDVETRPHRISCTPVAISSSSSSSYSSASSFSFASYASSFSFASSSSSFTFDVT